MSDLQTILARRRAATDEAEDESDGDAILARRRLVENKPKDPIQKSMQEKTAMFGQKIGQTSTTITSDSVTEHVQSGVGGGGDLASIMAARRRKVDASLVGDDELDTPNIDSKGRGRVKRSEEAMHKVMEARRTHVAIMEQKMKEVEGGIDADQALALGAHTVREIERKRVMSQQTTDSTSTPSRRTTSSIANLQI